MTIKENYVPVDSTFGVFYDKELTQECTGITELKLVGEARIKKLRLYFGSPCWDRELFSSEDGPIKLWTTKGQSWVIGDSIRGGPENSKELWIDLSDGQRGPRQSDIELNISRVYWY